MGESRYDRMYAVLMYLEVYGLFQSVNERGWGRGGKGWVGFDFGELLSRCVNHSSQRAVALYADPSEIQHIANRASPQRKLQC